MTALTSPEARMPVIGAKLVSPAGGFPILSIEHGSVVVAGAWRAGEGDLVIEAGACRAERPVRIRRSEPAGEGETRVQFADPSVLAVLMTARSARDPGALAAALGQAPLRESRIVQLRGASRKVAGLTLTAAGVAAALVFFAGAAYSRYGVVTAPAELSTADTRIVRSTHAGLFYPYKARRGERVRTGELIGVVAGNDNRTYGVAADCDCFLGDFPVGPGMPVAKGAPIARLVQADTQISVAAHLPVAELWRIESGLPVEILADGKTYAGRIETVAVERRSLEGEAAGAPASARLAVIPDQPIDPAALGTTAEVRIKWLAGGLARLIGGEQTL